MARRKGRGKRLRIQRRKEAAERRKDVNRGKHSFRQSVGRVDGGIFRGPKPGEVINQAATPATVESVQPKVQSRPESAGRASRRRLVAAVGTEKAGARIKKMMTTILGEKVNLDSKQLKSIEKILKELVKKGVPDTEIRTFLNRAAQVVGGGKGAGVAATALRASGTNPNTLKQSILSTAKRFVPKNALIANLAAGVGASVLTGGVGGILDKRAANQRALTEAESSVQSAEEILRELAAEQALLRREARMAQGDPSLTSEILSANPSGSQLPPGAIGFSRSPAGQSTSDVEAQLAALLGAQV